jgi:hypothetical protein
MGLLGQGISEQKMSKVVCVGACATVACDAGAKENQLAITSSNINAFQLGLNQYTFLTISYGDHKEVVRYDGSIVSRRFITVERASNAREIPKGAKVSFEIGCEFLAAYVCQRVVECADGGAGEGNQALGTNNIWTGTNVFRKLSIGTAQLSPESLATFGLLTIDKGFWSSYTTTSSDPRYGFLATVNKSSTSGKLFGGRFVARGAGSGSGELVGTQSEVANTAATTAALTANHAIVTAQNPNTSYDKVGVLVELRNRALNAATLAAGLGLDKLNEGSVAVKVLAQIASSDAEKVGWTKGIVFVNGSLGASVGGLATGLDFSDLNDVVGIDALVKLRSGGSIEWNAASGNYDSFKMRVDNTSQQFQTSWKGNPRLTMELDNGRLGFNDVGASIPVVSPTAGAPTGTFLTLQINGALYKLALLGA